MNQNRFFKFIVLAVILIIGPGLIAKAHPPFPAYLEHDISVIFSKNYIDATVRITFLQNEATAVRRQIDADNDKTLTPDECQRYVSQIANQHDWLIAKFNDKPLQFVMLYDPAYDQNGEDRVTQTPFTCEVSFFAQTPQVLDENVFVIEDSYRPETPALCIFSATTKSGAPLQYAVGNDGAEKRLPLRIASPDLYSASRSMILNLSKDHFAGEKP